MASVQSEADWALGRLAAIGQDLPTTKLLVRSFIQREAVYSSYIEGTVASLTDLIQFEVSREVEREIPDVREVSNYVHTLEFGLDQLRTRQLSLELICELHGRLMAGVRGQGANAGRFREMQNWIGSPRSGVEQARYVPPPPGRVLLNSLGALEAYINAPTELPKLVRAALVHYQFEAIHPFADGNGRIGRLLISLLLCRDQLLAQPLLSLSAYFERNRREYYDHLFSVSSRGTWEYWISFVLLGVRDEARAALERADRLIALRNEFRQTIQRSSVPARLLDLVDQLFASPIVRVADVHIKLKVNRRTALSYVNKLVSLGILEETTGKQRDRLFAAKRIIQAIE